MSYCGEYQEQLVSTINKLDLGKIELAISWLKQARDEEQQIFTCGNGGSASTASHFVTDMLKGASYGLTDSLSTMTAYANDVSYDCVFAEQLKNYASRGDLLLCISGSGNSPTVLEAAKYAHEAGCRVIALTGRDGGKLASMADLNIGVADSHMGRIEDLHLIICHMMCYHFMDTEK
jgi:D-sedoheptulose 7-phosphate isomerase